MDRLTAYSDDEGGASSSSTVLRPSTDEGHVTQQDDERFDRTLVNGQSQSEDLGWLAPPSKQRRDGEGRVILDDVEWGLGRERRDAPASAALEDKLAVFHRLKREKATHFNQSLMRNRAFHNPHIYAKLVEWVDVDETDSAYDKMLKAPEAVQRVWSAGRQARRQLLRDASAERLAEMQKRRQEEADEARTKAKRSQVDFVSSSGKKRSVDSKYDDARALAEKRARVLDKRISGSRDSRDKDEHRPSLPHTHHVGESSGSSSVGHTDRSRERDRDRGRSSRDDEQSKRQRDHHDRA